MSKTVVGLFHDYHDAEAVVHDLLQAGLPKDEISLIAGDEHGRHAERISGSSGPMASSAGTGAALGGVAGLVLGLAALAVPGIGLIVAVGPLAAALTGAGIGAATGGLMGALSHMGVPEDEANLYAESIRRGAALVTVRSDNEEELEKARSILSRHDVVDVEETDSEAPAIDSLSADQTPHCDLNAPELRRHFESHLSKYGYTFDQSCVAYRYGWTLGHTQKLKDQNWTELTERARTNWENVNPGSWNTFSTAIEAAFQLARSGKPATTEPPLP